jgi:SAM-dependent methyltransferase
MDTIYAQTIFNYLYANIDGKKISAIARSRHNEPVENLLYGEIDFDSLKKIIEYANPKKDGVFYDLGSGTGRVVLECHILFNFKKSIGIELLKDLHNKSLEVARKFNANVKPIISNNLTSKEFEFINKSFFEVNLSDADVILMNHPFKDGPNFVDLEKKFLNELKPGTKIITTIRSLKNPAIKLLGHKKYHFSWGLSTVYFHEI